MDHCCDSCKEQHSNSIAHLHLKILSKLPESSIYCCKRCGSYWMHQQHVGWDLLILPDRELKSVSSPVTIPEENEYWDIGTNAL